MLDTENHKAGGKRAYESDYPENVSGKIPKWIDVDSVTERYKITDCRSLDTLNKEEFKDKWMTLIDVEDCWSISRQGQDAEGKEVSHLTIEVLLHKKDLFTGICGIYAVITKRAPYIKSESVA